LKKLFLTHLQGYLNLAATPIPQPPNSCKGKNHSSIRIAKPRLFSSAKFQPSTPWRYPRLAVVV
jgi:hypothetical protein